MAGPELSVSHVQRDKRTGSVACKLTTKFVDRFYRRDELALTREILFAYSGYFCTTESTEERSKVKCEQISSYKARLIISRMTLVSLVK